MALNFGDQRFGDSIGNIRTFTRSNPGRGTQVINEGFAVTRTFNYAAGALETENDNMGTQIFFSLANESGASRNITIVVTNETRGTTLISGNVDLGDGQFASSTEFFSLEVIAPGDDIKISFGNEGVGTAIGSSTAASYETEVKSIFITQDETS